MVEFMNEPYSIWGEFISTEKEAAIIAVLCSFKVPARPSRPVVDAFSMIRNAQSEKELTSKFDFDEVDA
eukprot:15355065-Ditylum_brightwellii.AAC.1